PALRKVPYLKVVEPDLVPRRGEPYSNSSLMRQPDDDRADAQAAPCILIGCERPAETDCNLVFPVCTSVVIVAPVCPTSHRTARRSALRRQPDGAAPRHPSGLVVF